MEERKYYEENPMAFLSNPDNTMRCDVCPYNEDAREKNPWTYDLNCGQQNCWVECCCKGDENE